jgi:hypothetical protein
MSLMPRSISSSVNVQSLSRSAITLFHVSFEQPNCTSFVTKVIAEVGERYCSLAPS